MRAIFEALAWGDWLDEGDSAPRYCTLGGIAKTASTELPYLAVNEHVSAELARVAGLPAVPGVVVKNAELTGFVSLRFGPKGEMPPPGIPALLAQEQPGIAAGIVVFDCWIANTDRHSGNFAYSVTTKRAHVFDHDRALLSTGGKRRLESIKDAHLLGDHSIAKALVNGADLVDFAAELGAVSQRAIHLAVDEMLEAELLSSEDGVALVEFLIHRRDHIADMLRAAKAAGCFPSIVQGFTI